MNEIVTVFNSQQYNKAVNVFITNSKRYSDKFTAICIDCSAELISFLHETGCSIIDSKELVTKFKITPNSAFCVNKFILAFVYLKHYSESKNVALFSFSDILIQQNIFNLVDKTVKTICIPHKIHQHQSLFGSINNIYGKYISKILSEHYIETETLFLGTKNNILAFIEEYILEIKNIINKKQFYNEVNYAIIPKIIYFDIDRYSHFNFEHVALEAKHNFELVKAIKFDSSTPYIIQNYVKNKPLESVVYEHFSK